MSEMADLIDRSLSADAREEFDRRVEAGAAFLREELAAGRLDSGDPTIGLELECYVVDGDGRLARLPEGCLDETPVNRELGRHNVEINTPPDLLSEAGIEAQAETVREHLAAGREALSDLDRHIVLDAMWTVPPEEGTRAYLSAVEDVDGHVVASNMHEAVRYHAMDNDILARAGGEIPLDLPGVSERFPSILVESLATSIQPHLQVPDVAEFPAYYNAAIRTLGPVLALSTNSPFLPADLYGDDVDPDDLLAETFHELRIPVFEQSINAGQERGKVRFPADIDQPTDVVDRVVEDGTLVPFLREWVDGGDEASADAGSDDVDYTDAFWEFDHKHGTYWRWLRGVVGGDYVDERNDERSLRIEYRPLPTQPSVTDLVGLQCLVVGLLQGLVATDHPLEALPWAKARETFYGVVEDGLDAELHWVTADGERTNDPDVVYDELFSLARTGLSEAGVSEPTRERYLRPIERRWEARRAPSDWKLGRVRDALDAGATLADAVAAMQREYVERSAADEPFADWP